MTWGIQLAFRGQGQRHQMSCEVSGAQSWLLLSGWLNLQELCGPVSTGSLMPATVGVLTAQKSANEANEGF